MIWLCDDNMISIGVGGMQSDDRTGSSPKFIDLFLDNTSAVKLENAGDVGYANYKSAVSNLYFCSHVRIQVCCK